MPPDGLPLEEIQELIRLLLGADAPECDIDRVHRHVDQVKAGRLAGEAAPSHVVALLLSDVVGDAPDLVASGPFAPDRSRASDAVAVLKRHGVWDEIPRPSATISTARARGELPPPPGPAIPASNG